MNELLRPLGIVVAAFAVVVALAVVLEGSGAGFADTSVPCPTVPPGPTNIPGGATKTPSPTGTPCPKPTVTPTPTASLPDLVVQSMSIELETGNACYTATELGVRVVVANIGSADAGPFVVDANGTQQPTSGLAHGEKRSLWIAGHLFGKNTAFVDATFQVIESNEGNNELSQLVPVPTLPAPCTPAPTATGTSTPTPPPPLGGSGVYPDVPGAGGSSVPIALVTGIAVAIAAGATALVGVTWHARRRVR